MLFDTVFVSYDDKEEWDNYKYKIVCDRKESFDAYVSYYDVFIFCVNRLGNLKLHHRFFFLKIVLHPLRDRERKNVTEKDFWLVNKLLCVSFENKNDW